MRQNIDKKREENQSDDTNERPGFRDLSFLLELVRDWVFRELAEERARTSSLSVTLSNPGEQHEPLYPADQCGRRPYPGRV